MVIHPAAAQMPLSWPAGSLRHHRMHANDRYLASESYVPTHPTSPGWRGALEGRYGPSNIVPILGLGARVACLCTAFWAVLAAPVHMIDGRLREVRVARSIVVVLEVREPAGGRERARYTWSRASRFCLISVLYVDG